MMSETTIEPRQPIRFEKKKNIARPLPANVLTTQRVAKWFRRPLEGQVRRPQSSLAISKAESHIHLAFRIHPLIGAGRINVVTREGGLVEVPMQRQDDSGYDHTYLRLAIDAGQMAIWDYDVATDKLAGNPELYKLLGFSDGVRPSLDEIRAKYLPGERERIHAAAKEALLRGDQYAEAEFRYRVITHPCIRRDFRR